MLTKKHIKQKRTKYSLNNKMAVHYEHIASAKTTSVLRESTGQAHTKVQSTSNLQAGQRLTYIYRQTFLHLLKGRSQKCESFNS